MDTLSFYSLQKLHIFTHPPSENWISRIISLKAPSVQDEAAELGELNARALKFSLVFPF